MPTQRHAIHGRKPSQLLLRMAQRLDKPGYPWYVCLFDTLAGYCVRLRI